MMFIIITLLLNVSQCKLIFSENDDLDNVDMVSEYDHDTQICVEAAKLKHFGDPNAGLDHFVACLLKQLEKLPEDGNTELIEVKSTLENVEKFNEDPDPVNHNIVRRNVDEVIHLDTDESSEESRGWKNKNKNKKFKKQKKKEKKKLLRILEQEEEESMDQESEEEEVDEENTDVIEKDPPTQVLQFSAYSGATQPTYKPRQEPIEPQSTFAPYRYTGNRKQFLYSIDYQGNPHYIDEAEVSALLKTPQAKKAMMHYFHTQSAKDERPNDDFGQYYRVPETIFHDRNPKHPPYNPTFNQKKPIPGVLPKLEYFGPKDYVPESPYLIQGGNLSPGIFSHNYQSSLMPQRKTVFEKLEPKPRSLFKRSLAEEDSNKFNKRFGFLDFIKKKDSKGKESPKNSPKISKKPKRGKAKKENLISERCKKCQQESFAKRKRQFCTSVCSSSRSKSTCDTIEEIDCSKKNKGKKGREKLRKCQKCMKDKPNSSKTTVISKPLHPERSILGQKKKCRDQKKESESCLKLLNKCNSRVFRATHADCDKQPGDIEWLKKKCVTKVFRDKFESTCKELCNDEKYSAKNPKACEFVNVEVSANIESLEDIVAKCKKSSYKMMNLEKCEVVETIDVILTSGEQTDEDEEEKENNEASQVKNEVVKSIERQTQERKNSTKKPPKEKTKIEKEKKQKKNKKNTKKENQKTKNRESDKKSKSRNPQKKIKKEKPERMKSKCNKPKYAATHPEECRNLQKMEKIIRNKCRKEKYRNKHKERCDMLTNAGKKDLANNVMDQVMDVRCQKESFRSNYTRLCKGSSDSESIPKTSWLSERCKHEKFAQRNKDLCLSINKVETDQVKIEAISNVVEDIKTIVTNESNVNKEESETMSGTTPPSTTPVENEISEKESENSEETTIKS